MLGSIPTPAPARQGKFTLSGAVGGRGWEEGVSGVGGGILGHGKVEQEEDWVQNGTGSAAHA